VLCYRTGERSEAVRALQGKHWRRLPKDYGTRWIMARVAENQRARSAARGGPREDVARR